MAHSPLPWRVEGEDPETVIYHAGGECLSWVDAGPERANAEFIVLAVNSHAALLAALKEITFHFASVMDGPMIAGAGVTFADGVGGIPTIKAAKAAIALAEATHG